MPIKLAANKHWLTRCLCNVVGTKRKSIAVGYLQKMLPDEVLLKVCSFCSPAELCRLSITCKRLSAICKDDCLW